MFQLQERLAPLRARSGVDELSFRLAVLFGQPHLIDATFRLFSAGIMPAPARKRFLYSGLEPADLSRTLRSIRSLADWPEAWAVEARRQEMRARAAELSGTPAAISAGGGLLAGGGVGLRLRQHRRWGPRRRTARPSMPHGWMPFVAPRPA